MDTMMLNLVRTIFGNILTVSEVGETIKEED